jgi:hypothetical protein
MSLTVRLTMSLTLRACTSAATGRGLLQLSGPAAAMARVASSATSSESGDGGACLEGGNLHGTVFDVPRWDAAGAIVVFQVYLSVISPLPRF